MKKITALLMIIMVCITLNGCGKTDSTASETHQGVKNLKNSVEQGDLRMILNSDVDTSCSTEDGYYYLTEMAVKLENGSYGYNIMYMDYATKQEVYLCSNAGCKHNSEDCTSVMPYEPGNSDPKIFVDGNYLFFLSKEYNNTGSKSVSFSVGDPSSPETTRATLYRMNLNGADRKKCYEFDANYKLENTIMSDGNSLYFIADITENESEGNATYTTASKRELIKVDVSDGTSEIVCDIPVNGNTKWQKVIGCYEKCLIIEGIDYGTDIGNEQKMSDDDYKKLFNNSKTKYARLDIETGKLEEFYSVSNSSTNAEVTLDNIVYLSVNGEKGIHVINAKDGSESILGAMTQNYIRRVCDGVLCCQDWDCVKDSTNYFVDINTGNVEHSTLTNEMNGWNIDIMAETKNQYLVIYNYDAIRNKDDSYEINRYMYALINKSDLQASKAAYNKIAMVGKGK